MRQKYSTESFAFNEQFDYWKEDLCQAFVELAPERNTKDSTKQFKGEIYQQPLSEIIVSRVRADAHLIRRTQSQINRSSEEVFFANLQIQGRGKISQSGSEIIAEKGDLVMVDASKPYEIVHDDAFDLLSVKIPYTWLKHQTKFVQLNTAQHVSASKGYAPLILSYMNSILDDIDTELITLPSMLAENLVNLIALTLDSNEDSLRLLPSQQRLRLKEIIDYISRNISDPRIDLLQVSKKFNLSPRYIQKMFAATGTTFSQMLLQQRLNLSAALLRKPEHRSRSITEVAMELGFNDISYFSKAFKHHYQETPRRYRNKHLGPKA